MWHDLTHGHSSLKYSATEPFFTSVLSFEFHVRPTLLWPHSSMIVFMCGGCAVPWPWTSTQISTPASAAALPHGTSDLPICSRVFFASTPLGRSLGRTFTPLPPMSATSSTNFLHSSIFFFTSAWSVWWKSHVEPHPQI